MKNYQNKLLQIGLFAFICMLPFGALMAQGDPKRDKKMGKTIMGSWKTKNIERGGKVIDINNITGEVTMDFYIYKKKNKKTKKLEKITKFKMDMGGQHRIFNYEVKADSIRFEGLEGWEDMKIVTLEKEKLIAEQIVNGEFIRWNMVRNPDPVDLDTGLGDKDKKKESKNTGRGH